MNIFLKRASALFHSLLVLVLIFMVIMAAFLFDHSKISKSSFRNWISFNSISENKQLEKIPIIKIKDHVLLNITPASQFPELPRGCEVTSLAMLLNAAGVKVNKMELAQNVKKETTPKRISEGQIFYGNPNDGFVGSMQNFNEPGFGVYHKPIFDLAEKYLPGKVKDISGSDFQDLKIYLSDSKPVWVITNTLYQKLASNMFQSWNTPTGPVKVTYKEHSILLTGYDASYIYFNDPLTGVKNKKAPIKDFEESWVQMGRQAITYLP